MKDASLFYILPSEDGSSEYEFNIAWDKDDDYEKCLKSVASPNIKINQMHKLLFFSTELNVLGHNSSKMSLKKDVRLGDSLTLRKRMDRSGKKAPAGVEKWIKGQDVYYIHCSSSFIGKGYVAVINRPDPNEHGKYINEFKCYSSVNSHNDYNVSMLFQLHPFSPDEIKKKRDDMDRKFCHDLIGKEYSADNDPNGATNENESLRMAADLEIHEASSAPKP